MRAESLSPERRREIAKIASAAAVKARERIPKWKRSEMAKKTAAERWGKKSNQPGAALDAPTPSDTQSFSHQSEGEAQYPAAGRSPIPNAGGGVGPGAVARPAIPSEAGGSVPGGTATARDMYTESQLLRQQLAQPPAPVVNRGAYRPLGPGDCTLHSSPQRCAKCGATVNPVHMMIRLIHGFFCEKCCPACHPVG